MEALNAVGLKPICILPEKKAKPRRIFPSFNFSFSGINPQNLRQAQSVFIHGSSLTFLSSLLNSKPGFALTYEEALQQSVTSSTGVELDADSAVDSIINFAGNNPLVIGGGLAVLLVPLIVSQVLGGSSKPYGVDSAKSAYAKLGDDDSAQLLDIRSPKELKEVGTPDIRGFGKKPIQIVYKGDDKPGFLKKLALKLKEPENTTLLILDKYDGNSELVAELAVANGFKAAYAIKDGAEGPRGWKNSGLPWLLPSKTMSLDFANLTEAINGDEALPLTLGLAAATGLGLLAFTEAETILQLLGTAALIQIISKKLLFAEDRKKTLQQVDEFLSTKVAPNDLVSDVKQIGTALLPTTGSGSKALPAPTDPSPAVAEKTVENAEPTPVINSTPPVETKTESKKESHAGPRPLSPYASYPDFKPPSSPSPSQP